ncbi:3-phosphoshikimate 1-carboxyvinyltransferase [Petroclostridium sp. X23]|uniref:3-phosphoshikimate 1-carboxyvinyltransferase n=1 Tax=Petroclostridium sp. X23 TaxID=3045146 RepID=UPI0024AD3669|nr:3-phosphoshikimate 1-carboxyvinyltransferase [Petroclostridium sp. X23]WHH56895.1 3-phosphoshikimate 1-carboxyvinyltransferase [Petroclostridium sp. X23]
MIISPAKSLKGEITIPGDKSISHRAVMFGAIAEGITEIDGFLTGEDCLSTIDCFRKLGIQIDTFPHNKVKVFGKGMYGLQPSSDVLYTGNSGTTTRLLLGLLSGQGFESKIDGDESIRKRPMGRVIEPLTQMGANITGMDNNNLCPLVIKGQPLHGIKYKLPVASAQLKSALLLASLYAQDHTIIIEPEKSRDHSELMLNYFGANIYTDGLDVHSAPVSQLHAQHITVPGDISSAAYFMVAGLIVPDSEIVIKNVGINPTRTGIIDVLTQMGANIHMNNTRTMNNEPVADVVVKSSSLVGTIIEGALIPRLIDEIPVIAVAAAAAKGTTIIKDAQELKVKESNRIKTVVTELKKTGINIQETDDGMIIEGGQTINGAQFESYHDHRIAMSMAVAGLVATNESFINGSDSVNISFPGYFKLLECLQR